VRININDLIHLMKNTDKAGEDGVRFLMNEILREEPEIGWEFGPDPIDQQVTVMALTCEGDLQLLDRLESELGLPIKGDGWMIVAGVLPRDWEKYFEVTTDDGDSIGVEGNDWLWNLAKLDRVAEINLHVPSILQDKKCALDCAKFILFAGEIGELNFGRLIQVKDVSFGINPPNADYKKMEIFRSEFIRWFPMASYFEFLNSKLRSD
jgi:hypothetical protein